MIFTENYQKCDSEKFGEAFVGANSSEGFVGMFDSLVSEEKMKRVYIIKGAAGTGKSTLLRRIHNVAIEKNINSVRYACSSDPYSLDLITLNDEIAILDGTAPHVYDMKYPGAASSLIDLSDYWNCKKLEKFRSDIIELTKLKTKYYKEAYAKLNILYMLYSERTNLIGNTIDSQKLDKYLAKLVKEFAARNENGNVTTMYHRCISTAGRFRLDTLEKVAEQTVKINDVFGSAYIFTERLAHYLKVSGISHTLSVDPLNSSIISDIFLPSEKVLITAQDVELADRYVNMKRFVSHEKLSIFKGEIRLSKKCAETIDEEVLKYLRSAGKAHADLEKIYADCMDFDALGEYSHRLCNEIIESVS